MVRAYHCIFSTYGFWLPNDPRGSWSDWIRSWELLRFGGATPVSDRRSRAHLPHDVSRRKAAKAALRYPEVFFNGVQARAVARGFARAVAEASYLLHACSILPQHAHLVVARHERAIEQIISHLKAHATRQLREEGIHPLEALRNERGAVPSVWSRSTGWVVYLNTSADMLRSIRYVEQNPVKEGKPRQRWSFLIPYSG